MKRRPRCWLAHRLHLAMLLPATLLTHMLLFPPLALAGCGVTDFGACADDVQYNLWYGWTAFIWTSVDAPLLQAAYLIDVFRDWLVRVAFTSAYQALTTLIDPLIVPFAIVALIVGYILFALTPLFGHTRLMNVRHVLTWTLMAPLLLTISGMMIAQVEQIRVELGSAIFTQVSAIAPGAIFGVSASGEMAEPKPLYDGGNPCGSGSLARPGGSIAGVMRMDDLAAALLWANAQDIHCPKAAGEGQDLPDAFYLDPPDGPKYASSDKVGDMNIASDRQAAINNIQRGFNRVVLGSMPSALAVLEAFVQLLFALALISLWIGLPFAVAFIFFEESNGSVVILFRQGLGVLKTSWLSSFLLAIVFAALKSSAEQGNATAYTGVSLLALLLMLFLIFVGLKTMLGSINALNQAMLASVGVSATEPLQAAGKVAAGAAGLAVGAATGGVAMAATAAAGYAQTGSGRYAAGAALGRITPIANVGEVAAAMGWVQDEELVSGLYAGQRSLRGGHTMRLQMQTDAKRTNAEGLTFREAAQERGITRRIEGAQSDRWRELNEGAANIAGAAAGAVSSGYNYMRSGQVLQDIQTRRDRAFEAVGDRWQQIKNTPSAFRDEVQERMQANPPSNALAGAVQGQAAMLAVAHDWLAPDQRYHAYSMDEGGKLHGAQPRKSDELPPDALTIPNVHVNVTRLLRQGYTVQQNRDKTVTFWHNDPEKAAAAHLSPNQERERLVRTKAVTEEGIRQALGHNQAAVSPDAPTAPASSAQGGNNA